jgi:hypothetical protein
VLEPRVEVPGAIIDKSELDKLPRVEAAFIEPMQAKLTPAFCITVRRMSAAVQFLLLNRLVNKRTPLTASITQCI